jgi:Ca2+:H+ antiporter
VFLFISYVIGLWFTLRTHAAVIWQAVPAVQAQTNPANTVIGETIRSSSHGQEGNSATGDSRSPIALRDSGLYKRILGQSLGSGNDVGASGYQSGTLHVVPPRSTGDDLLSTSYGSVNEANGRQQQQQQTSVNVPGLSHEENARLFHGVAEVAAVAATAAVQDVARHNTSVRKNLGTRPPLTSMPTVEEGIAVGTHDTAGGHDAPNWSKAKSSIILLGATVLYAIIAEILVDTVDVVLENFDIDEKFLGITLFALVPNTTEFLVYNTNLVKTVHQQPANFLIQNAISFAMNGNIALSMEIGSAYALQVCLLQIPALVAFSAFFAMSLDPKELLTHTFSLIFPQWDLVTVILCVFLLSYMYGEGKSNYFKVSSTRILVF